jgi:hypothetical protein
MASAIDLDELIAERGEFFGHALPRDSSTANELSWEPDWLALEDPLGGQRAELLNSGASDPSDDEVGLMLSWQVQQALKAQDDDVTPGIWFCGETKKENKIVVIVCWGAGWETSRRLFGVFPNRDEAVAELRKEFILENTG